MLLPQCARVPTLRRISLLFQIFSIWEFTGANSLRNPLLTTHSSPDCTQSDRSFCVHPPNERLLCSFAPIVRGRSRWAHTRRDVSYESCLARPDAKTPHNVAASKFQARLPIIALPPPWGLLFTSVDEWTTTGQQMSPVSSVNKPIRGGEAALSPFSPALTGSGPPLL